MDVLVSAETTTPTRDVTVTIPVLTMVIVVTTINKNVQWVVICFFFFGLGFLIKRLWISLVFLMFPDFVKNFQYLLWRYGMFDPLPSFKGEVSKVETQKSFSQNLGVDRSNSSLIHQWVISGEAGCAGLCGGVNSNEGCYCDSSCTYYGDCCSNYQEECVWYCKISGGKKTKL